MELCFRWPNVQLRLENKSMDAKALAEFSATSNDESPHIPTGQRKAKEVRTGKAYKSNQRKDIFER